MGTQPSNPDEHQADAEDHASADASLDCLEDLDGRFGASGERSEPAGFAVVRLHLPPSSKGAPINSTTFRKSLRGPSLTRFDWALQ